LMVARSAISRSREVGVSESAAAAARGQPTIPIVTQVMQQIAGCSIKDLRPNGNSNKQVFAGAARTIRAFAMEPTLSDMARVVTQVQQRVQRSIGDQNYVAATAAIAARWTTAGHKLLAPESRNTVTAVAPLHVYLGAINKHPKIQNDAPQ